MIYVRHVIAVRISRTSNLTLRAFSFQRYQLSLANVGELIIGMGVDDNTFIDLQSLASCPTQKLGKQTYGCPLALLHVRGIE